MANQQHLDLLKEGTDTWNPWRKAHPEILPDLSGTNLSGTNLKNADLRGAELRGDDLSIANLIEALLNEANLSGINLNGALLRGVNLSEANLSGTNLSGADLKNADLRGADLSRTNLSKANLNGADLSFASLSFANLSGQDLHGKNLSGANLSRANLSKADLSKADLSGTNLINANLSFANLSGQDLHGKNLSGANLSRANLSETNLKGVILSRAKLSGATFIRAYLIETDLRGKDLNKANFSKTDVSEKDLSETNLSEANLRGANLRGANLNQALIIRTNLTSAILNDCSIYGIAAWDVQLKEANQLNLIITPPGEPVITVDNLKIAQFIYLLLNNQEIRDVINTIISKVVLILGRFTPERKIILNALRDELRVRNYLPIVFDFEKPTNRDLTETISTLAHMARFVIADITQAKSIPQELERIVPGLPSVPVQPLLQARAKEYGMFEHFQHYPWVLKAYRYTAVDQLLASLEEHVIAPAEQKAREYGK